VIPGSHLVTLLCPLCRSARHSSKVEERLDKLPFVAHLKWRMAPRDDYPQRVRCCADRLAAAGVDALAALFDLTSNRLVRFCVTVTRNQHDAEDAVQAALVKVASRPALLAAADNPWAYLLQIVRNESLAIMRRRRRASCSSLIDLATSRRIDELEQEETHRAVWMALRTLPTEQAEVVVLKIWESMTFAEIAHILEASPNTVASRYQYAMNKLAVKLTKARQEARHA
jgi:RNA polymerase sigma-70 factor, ECF subfamily